MSNLNYRPRTALSFHKLQKPRGPDTGSKMLISYCKLSQKIKPQKTLDLVETLKSLHKGIIRQTHYSVRARRSVFTLNIVVARSPRPAPHTPHTHTCTCTLIRATQRPHLLHTSPVV
jgi:hypothetical protein